MRFEDLLTDNRPHVFDGAMGTMLYSKGVFINRCYDELNVKEPDLVREIHRQYVKAGAELLETNSFGANEIKLAEYGLEHEVIALNAAAARLAREAGNGRTLVGGAVGSAFASSRTVRRRSTMRMRSSASKRPDCSRAVSISSYWRRSPTWTRYTRPSWRCASCARCRSLRR
jgi:methionine synthase I (cobalamin-dependent)